MFQEVVRTDSAKQVGGGCTLNLPPRRTDNMHANATLTPRTRAKMVQLHLSQGRSLRASAAAFGVCEKTVRKWLQRARQTGSPARFEDRSSLPRRQPRKTS